MSKVLSGIHPGAMNIPMCQTSVPGNILDELNLSRIEKLYQEEKRLSGNALV